MKVGNAFSSQDILIVAAFTLVLLQVVQLLKGKVKMGHTNSEAKRTGNVLSWSNIRMSGA